MRLWSLLSRSVTHLPKLLVSGRNGPRQPFVKGDVASVARGKGEELHDGDHHLVRHVPADPRAPEFAKEEGRRQAEFQLGQRDADATPGPEPERLSYPPLLLRGIFEASLVEPGDKDALARVRRCKSRACEKCKVLRTAQDPERDRGSGSWYTVVS